MKTFYIGSKLENAAAVQELRDALVVGGLRCIYDWTQHGSVRGEDSPALRERLATVAVDEACGAADADLAIFLLPGGRGTHVELGAALGRPARLKGRVVIWSPTPAKDFATDKQTCAFYHHPRVEQRRDASIADLAAWLLDSAQT